MSSNRRLWKAGHDTHGYKAVIPVEVVDDSNTRSCKVRWRHAETGKEMSGYALRADLTDDDLAELHAERDRLLDDAERLKEAEQQRDREARESERLREELQQAKALQRDTAAELTRARAEAQGLRDDLKAAREAENEPDWDDDEWEEDAA